MHSLHSKDFQHLEKLLPDASLHQERTSVNTTQKDGADLGKVNTEYCHTTQDSDLLLIIQ